MVVREGDSGDRLRGCDVLASAAQHNITGVSGGDIVGGVGMEECWRVVSLWC